nr:DMT family transporter [uncultured Hyphomonas sp.]
MTRDKATWVGFSAVALWALLALFTVASEPVPPFLLNALTFGIGGAVGLIWIGATGGLRQLRQVPLGAYAFGTLGLFGYHFLYFTALRMAPAAEAGLICYLWPLFIVVFSGLLPGETLRPGHLIGALMAFAGAVLIVAGGLGALSGALAGYGVAFAAALTWATYSLGSRRLKGVPTAAVAVNCLLTALLSIVAHIGLEATIWPVDATGWLAVIALGLGTSRAGLLHMGHRREGRGHSASGDSVLCSAPVVDPRPCCCRNGQGQPVAGRGCLADHGRRRSGRTRRIAPFRPPYSAARRVISSFRRNFCFFIWAMVISSEPGARCAAST